MSGQDSSATRPGASRQKRKGRDKLGRIGFSISEAARALGMTPEALRRLIERHAQHEGGESVAMLNAGIVATKRRGMGKWLIIVPPGLRG